MDSLEEFMRKEGWIRKESVNYGVCYYTWKKGRFQIEEEDIMEV